MYTTKFSEYEIQQVDDLIDEIIETYNGLDLQECRSSAWCAYVEVRNKFWGLYPVNIYWEKVINRIVDELEKLRHERNEQISTNSKLSLNQCIGESKEEVSQWLVHSYSDFTNGIALWNYAKSLGYQKYQILKLMSEKEEDDDIIRMLNLQKERYYELKEELKGDMYEYENI